MGKNERNKCLVFKVFFYTGQEHTLEHLEDDIINNGAKGGDNAINFLKSVRNMLIGGAVNMTVKWDRYSYYMWY